MAGAESGWHIFCTVSASGMKARCVVSVLLCVLSLCLCGCPQELVNQINGVFYVGEEEPDKWKTLLSQTYYLNPQENFHPGIFDWNKSGGVATLRIMDETQDLVNIHYFQFYFNPDNLREWEEGEKLITSGRIMSYEDPHVYIDVVVKDYETTITDKNKVFYFYRQDYEVTLMRDQEILGYFRGALMKPLLNQ